MSATAMVEPGRRFAGRTRTPERRAAAAVCVLGLAATAVSVVVFVNTTRESRRREFEAFARDTKTTIERRVASYGEILHGLRSLFAASQDVNRAEFRRWVETSGILARAPGAQALSFNRRVRRADLVAFERSVRSDRTLTPAGYPGFAVRPREGTGDLVVIDYIEPFELNTSAFGFDVASEPIRRAAVDAARDGGTIAASAPLRLLQGEEAGFLLTLAVYRDGVPVTAPARRRSFLGVATAVFSSKEMFRDVLGPRGRISVEIYDVGPTLAYASPPLRSDNLLFDDDGRAMAARSDRAPKPNMFLDINVGDRRWRIFAQPGPGFTQGAERFIPAVAGAGGALLTLLISGLILAFGRSRRLAVSLAEGMTIELRDREQRLAAANEELLGANRDLASMNQTIRDFVSTAAHDLRNPLLVVTGYSELLLERWTEVEEDERKRWVAVVERQGRHLSRLVDDLLTLSRIEADSIEPQFDAVPLAKSLSDAAEYYARDHDVRVGADPDVTVWADPEHVHRIVANLVGNAVKYGAPPIEVIALGNGEWVDITVRDHGDGVPPDFEPRLFGKFARADDVREHDGAGLGLSIVAGLARVNGGAVWHERAEGGGAVFGVRLPRAAG